MKRCSMLPLQQAMYERLVTNTARSVFDVPPQDAVYPYILIGDDTAGDIGTKTDHADEVFATVHCWSRAFGLTEAKTLVAEVVAAFTDNPLQVQGFQVKMVNVDFRSVHNDPDGITRHGVVRLRFKLFQKE